VTIALTHYLFVAAYVPLLCEQCFAAAAQQPTSPPKSPDGVRPFAEGVRIDWPHLMVEMDAEVVLREGPLELFACSPQTREHESILTVSARPLHIYQAMGLIGLTPGKPLRFDEAAKRWEGPTGDRVELRVRYTDESGRTITAYPENWVATAKPQALELTLHWVFAGSTNLSPTSPNPPSAGGGDERGGEGSTARFAADADGTIACLVDFESALIALEARHSADNEQLWLIANTAAIPPRGTKCTLLIRSAHRPPVEVDLVDELTVRYKDQSLGAEQLAKLLRPSPDENRPARLVIHPTADVSDETAAGFVQRFRESFGGQLVIETRRALQPGDPLPKPNDAPADEPP